MELQEIHKKILALCADDYTGLWMIVSAIAEDAYSFETVPDWVRQKTIDILRDLLQSNLIAGGRIDPASHDFRPFYFSVEDTIGFVEREWETLGKTPNIGDVCEFFITLEGKQLAQKLNLI
jgi:hypothetical protein